MKTIKAKRQTKSDIQVGNIKTCMHMLGISKHDIQLRKSKLACKSQQKLGRLTSRRSSLSRVKIITLVAGG